MNDAPTLTTASLLRWVLELHAGNPAGAEPEFQRILRDVRRFAASAFRKFPRVQRFAELDDVLNGSMLRLLAAFRDIRPTSTREFYALANTAIRRELLDLIKKFYRASGPGAGESAVRVGAGDGEHEPVAEGDSDLDRMAAFHRAVEKLPVAEREAFGLRYYHGWTQADIGELFGVGVKTVERWQSDAKRAIRDLLPD